MQLRQAITVEANAGCPTSRGLREVGIRFRWKSDRVRVSQYAADRQPVRHLEPSDADLRGCDFSGMLGGDEAGELCLYLGQRGEPDERG